MFGPLSTTFVPILRLNGLLSTTKFQVETAVQGVIREARYLGVNQKDDH